MNNVTNSRDPEYSVLITSYRSLRFLEECLGSVLRSTGPEFELLFLENGSPEPEAEWIAANLPDPRLRVFRVPETRFFAGGINYLAERARGKYLVTLNADTRVEPGWLESLDAVLKGTGFEAVTADVREALRPGQPGDHLFAMDAFGLVHYTRPLENAPPPESMVGGCGLAVRRDVYEELGGFDGDFKMYFEEIDLCWRMILRGYRVGYAPEATVYHVGQGSSAAGGFLWNRFRGRRNRVWAMFKNAGPATLAWFSLTYPFVCLGGILAALVRGKLREAFAETAAFAAAAANLGIPLAKRRAIQRSRVVSDAELRGRGFLMSPLKGLAMLFSPKRLRF